jgi:catechol 2,3-dioxygenase-like lactoylglutathione lyase family enzyme
MTTPYTDKRLLAVAAAKSGRARRHIRVTGPHCFDAVISDNHPDRGQRGHAILAPLGGARILEYGEIVGFGVPPKPDFWIGPRSTGEGFRESHVAFTAPDRAAVRAFFAAALETGAEVLHEPRVRPEYHPDYYGAFVRDPDGNNVEAVCHLPE